MCASNFGGARLEAALPDLLMNYYQLSVRGDEQVRDDVDGELGRDSWKHGFTTYEGATCAEAIR